MPLAPALFASMSCCCIVVWCVLRRMVSRSREARDTLLLSLHLEQVRLRKLISPTTPTTSSRTPATPVFFPSLAMSTPGAALVSSMCTREHRDSLGVRGKDGREVGPAGRHYGQVYRVSLRQGSRVAGFHQELLYCSHVSSDRSLVRGETW